MEQVQCAHGRTEKQMHPEKRKKQHSVKCHAALKHERGRSARQHSLFRSVSKNPDPTAAGCRGRFSGNLIHPSLILRLDKADVKPARREVVGKALNKPVNVGEAEPVAVLSPAQSRAAGWPYPPHAGLAVTLSSCDPYIQMGKYTVMY